MSLLNELLPLLGDSDDDLVLLTCLLDRKPTPVLPRAKNFNFETLHDDYCKIHFRFYKFDLLRLKSGLNIPYTVVTKSNVKVPGIEALCILLKRLAYPNRYADLMKIFPRSTCELSHIFNHMISYIYETKGHLLLTLRQPYLNDAKIKEFSSAIYLKGSPYDMCIGFIDGTVRAICRPEKNQKEYYNGHKRVHALKFQSVMFPNGLIATMHGPVSGRRHDAYILQQSQLIDQLEDFKSENGAQYYIYGDPAYPLKTCLMVPYKGPNISAIKRKCNKRMSRVRESVEWGFAKIIQQFAFLDYKKNIKIGIQPVGKYYTVGALLTNCHTCLYGSQVSEYFECNPPTLETYLD